MLCTGLLALAEMKCMAVIIVGTGMADVVHPSASHNVIPPTRARKEALIPNRVQDSTSTTSQQCSYGAVRHDNCCARRWLLTDVGQPDLCLASELSL